MPTLKMTVAGLTALLIRKEKGKAVEAAAALVQHHHPHFPLLLVPRKCISKPPSVPEYSPLGEYLVRAAIDGEAADYVGYNVTGLNLSVINAPATEGIELVTDSAADASGCPKGNWDSLNWLLNLNDVSGIPVVPLDRDRLRRLSKDVVSLLAIGHGVLKGHKPVECVSAIRKISYEQRSPRAFTDAFEWSVAVKDGIKIQFTKRGEQQASDTLELRGDECNLMLLNLPKTKLVMGHLDAFEKLPFKQSVKMGSIEFRDKCDEPTVRCPDREPEPMGDSLCMGLVVEVDSVR